MQVSMKISFQIKGEKIKKIIKCNARVARIDPCVPEDNANYTVALEFLQIQEDDRCFLLKFIHNKNIKEAQELKRIYLKLKEMAGRLVEVEECHPTAEHFRKVIDHAVEELDTVAHILDFEINELKGLQ